MKPEPAPRLALSVAEACAALGLSWDFWQEHIAPEVRVVRRGRRKLVSVAELKRWLERNAELLLRDGCGHRGPAHRRLPLTRRRPLQLPSDLPRERLVEPRAEAHPQELPD